jgi:low affinity Fe/Cu permease
MIKKKIATLLFGAIFLNQNVYAANDAKPADSSTQSDTTQIQKVVDEYKAYITNVKPEIRDEIIAFRKETAKFNRQKREAYQKLSQDAQNYLAKEQEYKKKLPIKQKKLINLQNPGEKISSDDKAE